MTTKEKYNVIKYTSYTINREFAKKLSAEETKDFFDEELCKMLASRLDDYMNPQNKLFEHFDFALIFENKGELTEVQRNLVVFFIMKKDVNANKLISSLGDKIQPLIDDLYGQNKDNRLIVGKIVDALSIEQSNIFLSKHIDELNDLDVTSLLTLTWREGKKEVFRNLIANYPLIRECFIKYVSQPFYYEIIEDLNLDNSYLEKRREYLMDILSRANEFDNNTIKDTICDLFFHDRYKNVCLDLKTIVNALNSFEIPADMENARETAIYYYSFLKDFDSKTVEEIIPFIENFSINKEFLDKMFAYSQSLFKDHLNEKLGKDYSTVRQTMVKSAEGKDVPVFNFENASDVEKEVYMLISSVPLRTDGKSFVQRYNSDRNGEFKYKRRSCSIVNQANLSRIFGKDTGRVIFGYDDLSDRRITSATFSDGQTDGNETRFGRKRKTRECRFIPCQEIMNRAYGHTEISVEYNGNREEYVATRPSFILVVGRDPSPEEIEIAAEFGIPIRKFDDTKYIQAVPTGVRIKDENYEYSLFTKNGLKPRVMEIDKKEEAKGL